MIYMQIFLITSFVWGLIRLTGIGKSLQQFFPITTVIVSFTVIGFWLVGGIGTILFLTNLLV